MYLKFIVTQNKKVWILLYFKASLISSPNYHVKDRFARKNKIGKSM